MKRQIIGLALGAALLGAGSAQALLIDSFDTTQAELTRMSVGNMNSTVVGAGIIGGTRRLDLDVVTSTGTDDSSAQVLGSGLNLNNGTGQRGKATVTYANLGGVDLTDGGASDFLIFHTVSLDHDYIITVTLTDTDEAGPDAAVTGANTYVKRTFANSGGGQPQVVGPIFSPLPANYWHLLGLFNDGGVTIDPATNTALCPACGDDPETILGGLLTARGINMPFGGAPGTLDLTSIDKIVVTFDSGGGELDTLIDCIHTGSRASTTFDANGFPTFAPSSTDGNVSGQCTVVPEPASLLLLGTGMLGLGLVGARSRASRRRRQA